MTAVTVTALSVRPLPGADVRQFVCGEALTLGDLVYMKSDGKVWKANGGASSTAYCIGIVVSVSTFGATVSVADETVGVLYDGPVAGFTLTVGNRYWVSDTAGKLDTATGTVEVVVGIALTTGILLVKVNPMPVGGTTISPGAVGTTELAAKGVTTAKMADGAASEGLNGDQVMLSANVSTKGKLPIIFRINQAAAANGDTEITIAQKIMVIDFWVKLTGAGVASSVCTLKSTAAAISNALDTSGADTAIVRAGTLDNTNCTIVSGGKLRITGSAGATMPALTAFILAVPVA
jgi:adhesin HecA-like repeat protein